MDQYIPNSDTWIYENKGETIGFFSLLGNTLAAIFVIPQYQGKGIGSELVAKAKSLRETLELTVYSENPGAVAFYKEKGFQVVCEQTDTHTGHKELLMLS